MRSTAIELSVQGPRFAGGNAIFAQVGWAGLRHGAVYGLHDADVTEDDPAGFAPLYIQVGTYVTDEDGATRWED